MKTKDCAMLAPCPQCPFRADVTPFITAARASSILRSVIGGASFHCHKTIKHDDEDENIPSQNDRLCAGAVIIARKEDVLHRNQMVRIADWLGANFDDVREASPVYADAAAMIYAHKKHAREKERHADARDGGGAKRARINKLRPVERRT